MNPYEAPQTETSQVNWGEVGEIACSLPVAIGLAVTIWGIAFWSFWSLVGLGIFVLSSYLGWICEGYAREHDRRVIEAEISNRLNSKGNP